MSKLVVHPFFFGSYAVLALISYNTLQNLAVFRALFASIAISFCFFIIFLLVTRNFKRAGLISSLSILLIFSYGHVNRLIQGAEFGVIIPNLNIFIGVLWFILICGWILLVMRFRRSHLSVLNRYFNIVSIILVIFPIITIAVDKNQTKKVKPLMNDYVSLAQNKLDKTIRKDNGSNLIASNLPDIYYIVLDAYARSDILNVLYDYDNSDFINSLEDKGFYVANNSNSNYIITEQSISSSLNMVHIDDMTEFYSEHMSEYDWILVSDTSGKLVNNNQVSKYMKELGYQIVEFDSGYDRTQFNNADIYLKSSYTLNMNQVLLEMLLLDSSLVQLFAQNRNEFSPIFDRMFEVHRERILFALDNISNYADKDGNYFVYAHIISPHRPFVFGQNGEKIVDTDPYTLKDLNPGKEEHITLYRNQVNYLSQLVLEAVEEILTKSDNPPIIIIQSDHGSRVYREKNPNNPTKEMLNLPILNAYYFPGEAEKALYPHITPVNTFRIVFNEYFSFNIPLLDDQSYVLRNLGDNPVFVRACELYETCDPNDH